MTEYLPDISQVDFHNPEAIDGFAALACTLAGKTGAFDACGVQSQGVSKLRLIVKDWIYEVENHIDGLGENGGLKVVEGFDLMHRLAYGKPAQSKFINRHILNAFSARIQGDRTVDEFRLFHSVSDSLNRRRDSEFFGNPLKWYSLTLSDWLASAESGRLDRRPLDEAISVSTELLNIDLFVYASDQKELKRRIAKRIIPRITDLYSLDSSTLMSLFPFINSLLRLVPDEASQLPDEAQLRHILSSRADLHPLRREAFRIA